jgi:Lon-like protease
VLSPGPLIDALGQDRSGRPVVEIVSHLPTVGALQAALAAQPPGDAPLTIRRAGAV